MKKLNNIRDIKEIGKLESEYDLQKALILDRRLRLLVKEDSSLKPIHDKLFELIQEYESAHWSNSDKITDEQVEESEIAIHQIEVEQKFILQRKEAIRKQLKSFDMTQSDLGVLLGHRKSYMSELINGLSPFSLRDMIIIHRVLNIELSDLIPTYLQAETREKVRESILRLNKPKLQKYNKDLTATY